MTTPPPAWFTSASCRHDTAGEWTEAYGLYRDDYVRRDGDWRIAGRRYRSLARTGPRIESFGIPDPD